jgi:hypothetical protein
VREEVLEVLEALKRDRDRDRVLEEVDLEVLEGEALPGRGIGRKGRTRRSAYIARCCEALSHCEKPMAKVEQSNTSMV